MLSCSDCGQRDLDTAAYWVNDGIFNTGEPALRFTHDCASTSQSRTANSLNQIATIDGSSVSYDVKGNLSSYGGLSFTYDAFNRLIGVTGTGPSGSSVNMSYTYDALGRRVLSDPNSLSSMNTYYLYDGAQVLEDRKTGRVQYLMETGKRDGSNI